MSTFNVYNEELNRNETITVTLAGNILQETQSINTVEYFLSITTTIRQLDGSAFPIFYVKTLADVPPGKTVATDFTDLIDKYQQYFIETAELGQSSSSSSSVGFSSSSSSEGFSSSSSSSSEGFSSSSSSPI